jgi:hypothetical protein
MYEYMYGVAAGDRVSEARGQGERGCAWIADRGGSDRSEAAAPPAAGGPAQAAAAFLRRSLQPLGDGGGAADGGRGYGRGT